MEISAEMQRLLAFARQENASDIHIVAGLPPLLRINGEIVLSNVAPLTKQDTARLSMGLLNEEQQKVFLRDWQICCSVHDAKQGRFRVSIYYREGNPEMSIRPVMHHVGTREELKLPEMVEDFTRYASGLVLLTGPTGSGKTTTLNFMIDLINSERRCKIVTIEDPIEFVHQQKRAIVVQQELRADVRSFSAALRHVLRQDPDVIVVGEMRDLETMSTALTAAETGHLVLATLHTPNALQTVERVVSAFPADQQNQVIAQLANSLEGIIAQLLLPRHDRKGRVLATEILIVNMAVRSIIRDNSLHQLTSVMQTGRRMGMQTMDACLQDLYDSAVISHEIYTAHAIERRDTGAREDKG